MECKIESVSIMHEPDANVYPTFFQGFAMFSAKLICLAHSEQAGTL
jgi:hypothetical protein